jgi:hypothetical protein
LHTHRTSRFRDGQRKITPSTTRSRGTSGPVVYVTDTPSPAQDNEHLAATFVYAGINVESCGLFTGIRGQQIAARCVLTRTGKFPYQQEWKAIINVMDQAIRLHHHKPGTLTTQAKYLHQRTGGLISSLSHIVRAAAIAAIIDGSERITRELMDTISVDHSTESATATPPRQRTAAP